MNQLKIAIRATIVLTILTGLAYPLLVTGLAEAFFHRQSNGSLVEKNGIAIGSELIGQRFTKPEYFHGRPSAAGNDGYDATASGGSNLGPTNQKLVDRVQADIKKFRTENPGFTGPIPARYADILRQRPRSAYQSCFGRSSARPSSRRGRVTPDRIQALVNRRTEGRQWGIFGEPRVNVLLLSLDLDRTAPVRK